MEKAELGRTVNISRIVLEKTIGQKGLTFQFNGFGFRKIHFVGGQRFFVGSPTVQQ